MWLGMTPIPMILDTKCWAMLWCRCKCSRSSFRLCLTTNLLLYTEDKSQLFCLWKLMSMLGSYLVWWAVDSWIRFSNIRICMGKVQLLQLLTREWHCSMMRQWWFLKVLSNKSFEFYRSEVSNWFPLLQCYWIHTWADSWGLVLAWMLL